MTQFSDIPAVIVRNRQVAPGYYLLSLRLSNPLPPMRAGQFVMVKVPSPDIFLRRPFSIYDHKNGVVSILYKVTGKGTTSLAQAARGQDALVLGPLGNGFTLLPHHQPVIVAGGIGIAGIHLLWSKLRGRAPLYWGCAGESDRDLSNAFQAGILHTATMDGCSGWQGNVVDLLGRDLPRIKRPFQVFACGPEAMFESLRDLLQEEHVPCQVLLEERMACGIGVCFGCVRETRDAGEPYKRVCKEGPVFDLWQTSL